MTSLKEKLGFGFMRNEDEFITHNFVRAAKPRSSFDSAMSSILTNLLMKLVVPWINSCFEKYSEADFHDQMNNGFDFIKDWEANHPQRFGRFLTTARAFRDRFDYNHLAIYAEVIEIFDRKGWKLSDNEKIRMMTVILDLKDLIYKD